MRKSLIFIIFLCCEHVLAGDLSKTKPHPSLSPKDVAKIIMNALRKNDQPSKNNGVKVTFSFASPRNRQNTGPLERFNLMIQSKTYRPMINHRKATFENYVVKGINARIDVILISSDGMKHGFRFGLTKQIGSKYNGSWMTDIVIPIRLLTL